MQWAVCLRNWSVPLFCVNFLKLFCFVLNSKIWKSYRKYDREFIDSLYLDSLIIYILSCLVYHSLCVCFSLSYTHIHTYLYIHMEREIEK